jgi:hypothetical protein
MTKEEIREEVEIIMQALGVSHTRLNNLVNEIKDNLGRDTPLKAFELKTNDAITLTEFRGLKLANDLLKEALESLEYFLNPEG